MKINNNLPDVNLWEPVNSSQLSYKDKEKNKKWVSIAADTNSTMNEQHSKHESSALKIASKPHSKGTYNNNTNSTL